MIYFAKLKAKMSLDITNFKDGKNSKLRKR